MVKKTGLGKGLDALFTSNETQNAAINKNFIAKQANLQEEKKEENSVYRLLNINEIEPNKNQPRKEFDEEKIEDLAQSIKNYGIIQPLVVAKKDNYFSIIAGERRWRASKKAGLKEVPVIIREDNDMQNAQIALIENIQREDLNIVDKATGIKSLMETYGLTHQEVAEKIGKARSSITNSLRILNLDERVLEYARKGQLSESQCKYILEFEGKEEQYLACMAILSNKSTTKKERVPKEETQLDQQAKILYNQIQNQIESFFGSKVRLQPGKRKGKIIIEYGTNDDLERILGLLN